MLYLHAALYSFSLVMKRLLVANKGFTGVKCQFTIILENYIINVGMSKDSITDRIGTEMYIFYNVRKLLLP